MCIGHLVADVVDEHLDASIGEPLLIDAIIRRPQGLATQQAGPDDDTEQDGSIGHAHDAALP